MTFSYVWVTALFVLLLELLIFFLFILLVNFNRETSNFALAQRVGIQYAYAASLQSNGLVLNPRTTFQPGQPYSLMPLGTRTHGENARLTFDLSNYTIPFIAESNPAQPPPAIGMVIAPNGRIVASSYPAHYSTNMLFSQLLPHQSAAVDQAMSGISTYAKMQPDLLYVAETIWGKHEQPIGVFFVQTPEEPLSFTDVLQSAYSNWLTLLIIILLFLVITTPIGSLFSLLTTRGLVRRIHRLAAATKSFANGDYDKRVPISRLDEVGQLEYDFNQMANQLVESTNRQQELAGQNARLAERARISRELHDAISQDLFSVRMLAYGLQDALPQGSEVQTQTAALERTTSRMIREMRALLLELRPTHLEQLGLEEALKDLAASYGERLGMTVTADSVPVSLPPEVEHALLRVAQEALSNAARHAHATHVTLTLTQREEEVCLTIRDNGEGFKLDESQGQHGLGLNSMQERIRELHGTFTLHTAPGQGTEIMVCLPQKEEKR
jgi:NarL family two-component system sensor histidine kinase LiaS